MVNPLDLLRHRPGHPSGHRLALARADTVKQELRALRSGAKITGCREHGGCAGGV